MTQNLFVSKAAHDFQYQAINYIRGTVTAVTAGTAQNVQIGTLPAGAIIVAIHSRVPTAITGGGTLQIGSTSGGADLLLAIAETAGSELLQPLVGGPFATDTPVWVGITATATAGTATFTVLYSNN
jgi:hypothetical protein